MDKATSIGSSENGLYQSLFRSNVRKDILLFLKNNPGDWEIQEISRCIHASYAETKGAILGRRMDARGDGSLESMGIVVIDNRNASIRVSLSKKGQDVAGVLENNAE